LGAGLTVNGLKKRLQLHHIRFVVGSYPAAEVGAEGRIGGLYRLPAVYAITIRLPTQPAKFTQIRKKPGFP